MANEAFQEFGEMFAKTVRELGGRAENFYNEQKLKNRISGEEKQIQKIMEELGKILYRRYRDGVPLEDMQRRLCEQIDQRMERISQYKEEISGVKLKRSCPSCGAFVEAEMAFCPYCGASCTAKKEEQPAESEDVITEEEAVSFEEAEERTEVIEEESVTELKEESDSESDREAEKEAEKDVL